MEPMNLSSLDLCVFSSVHSSSMESGGLHMDWRSGRETLVRRVYGWWKEEQDRGIYDGKGSRSRADVLPNPEAL